MNEPDAESVTIALNALLWVLSDERRAMRLLDLTGLTPADLRARAGDPQLLAAVLGFLEAHEPDLIACAEEIGQRPQRLVAIRGELAA